MNGQILVFRPGASARESQEGRRVRPGEAGERALAVGDRIVLGTCAHVLLVCESEESARLSRSMLPPGENMRLSNYEQAIREVVLQRSETRDEYGRRLAGMVMNRLRGPRARAVFSATMVSQLALHDALEPKLNNLSCARCGHFGVPTKQTK